MAKSTACVILALVLCAILSTPAILAQGNCTPQYTVMDGDTLTIIATNQGVTLSALEGANTQLVDLNNIFPGQKLNIPCNGASTTPASPAAAQPVAIAPSPSPVTTLTPSPTPIPSMPLPPPASPIAMTPQSETTLLQQNQMSGNVNATCAPPVGQVAMGNDVPNAAVRYPYIVSLRTKNLPGATALNPVHYCGGTLIAENLVLTAAHCIFESPQPNSPSGSFFPNFNGSTIATDFPTAVIGATCTKGPGTTSMPVFKTIIHPKYNGALPFLNAGYDVGLMMLSGTGVTPPIMPLVKLDSPEQRLGLPKIPPGSVTNLLGYGITVGGGQDAPSLKIAQLNLLADGPCSMLFPNAYFMSQLCTSQPGTSSCAGDSGGPLILQIDENPANDIQVGIVSFGPPLACGGPNPNSVFTRVASFNAQSTSVMPTADTPNQSPVDNFIGGHLASLGVRAPVSAAGRR